MNWRYKWVSARLGGEPDVQALLRAFKAGWEPVPYGEQPDNIDKPCDDDKLGNFLLHRMPEEKAQQREADQDFLNAALNDVEVMGAITDKNIRQHIRKLRDSGANVSKVWDTPDLPALADPVFARKVQVAYEFLSSRGLA